MLPKMPGEIAILQSSRQKMERSLVILVIRRSPNSGISFLELGETR